MPEYRTRLHHWFMVENMLLF